MTDWIDAASAAQRLGVKPATLYAYVSRGLLHSRRDPGGRRSQFDAAEVDRLRDRGRASHSDTPHPLSMPSAVTTLGTDRPYYRGRDVLELARTGVPFEQVAALLWSGEEAGGGGPWTSIPTAVAVARRAQAALPATALPLDRLQVIVPTLGVTDPLRFNLERDAVIATTQALISGMVDALPSLGPAEPKDAPLARRLWSRLTPRRPEARFVRLLDAALVLLADHELAASTVAARVAASVRADPYAVVAAALGVVGAPMHGGASLAVERLFTEIDEPSRTARVIGEWLRRGERIPGAGHVIYRGGDARGTTLLDLVRAVAPRHRRLLVADAVVQELAQRRLPRPNIDLALATLAGVCDMVGGAGEAIFAVARTAGWVAHALEEYERRAPVRPRAVTPADQ